MADPNVNRQEMLWKVHEDIQQSIRFADTKSGALIVLLGGLLMGLFSVGALDHVYDFLLQRPAATPKAIPALAAFAFSGVAIFVAAWSIKPRVWHPSNSVSLLSFSDIRFACEDGKDYLRKIECLEPREVTEHLAEQVFTLAAVCERKFLWFNVAFYFALAAGCSAVLAF